MKKHIERTWTKQDGKDASRLLAELAKRAEKASGGFERPEKIQNSTGVVPAVPSRKGGEPERQRGEALQGSPQLTASRAGGTNGGGLGKVADAGEGQASASAPRGEDARRRLVFANDNCAGRVDPNSWVSVEMRRPASSADSNLDMFTGLESFRKTKTARWGEW